MEVDKKITVLVADDQSLVREGIAAIINMEQDMIVVGEAANGREAVEAYRSLRPDVVLMDLVMPEMSGTDATEAICNYYRNAKVIVLTTFDGDEDIYRALQAGAKTYLLKGISRKDLVRTIREVSQGSQRIPSEVAIRLAERISYTELTPREMDVLRLIARGNSNKEIAADLNLTEGTVKSYITNIFEKLAVDDRTKAVTVAIKRGLIHLD